MKRAVLILVLASSAHAAPQTYVEVDGMLGLSHPFIGVLMGGASVGYRRDDCWLRGQVSAGYGGDDEGSGFIGQARVGIEGRPCTAGGLACFVFGADLGLEYAEYTERGFAEPRDHYTLTSLVAIPRVGVDLGGEHVRFRAAFELDFGVARGRLNNDPPETFVDLIGGNVVAGAAYQW